MDMENYFRFVLALAFVLGLIGVLTLLIRKYGLGLTQTPMRRGAQRRLGLIEVLPIDAKRRAILLRRDQTEHLILLGPESDIVVETHIIPPHNGEDTPEFMHVLSDGKPNRTPQSATPAKETA